MLYLVCIQYQHYQRNLVHMNRPMYEAAVSPQPSKRHGLHMVALQYMDFCIHYLSMPTSMGNQHQLYIAVLVLYRLECIRCMDHQHFQANICM